MRSMNARVLNAVATLSLTSTAVCLALGFAAAAHAQSSPDRATMIGKIVPGRSTKADIQSAFGVPSRVVQFNDCGMAMDGQADETWEYRGDDAQGSYRIHVEFGDNGVVHLIAKIPDRNSGGKAVTARAVPASPMNGMSM